MAVREEQLVSWAKPPSETEDDRCLNAVAMVKDAVSAKFGNDVLMYTQGSHKNRTNIRLDSDVDVVVQHKTMFLNDATDLEGLDKAAYDRDYVDSDYTYRKFKDEVEAALREAFDYGDVERKNKCIRIKGNTYRVNADVVPAFTHHRKRGSPYRTDAEGIKFITDDGTHSISFPHQHHENGKWKHTETNLMYKKTVRILKHMRNAMIAEGKISKDLVSSFFIECLVWNLPKGTFNESTYKEMMKSVTLELETDMQDQQRALEYAEVSDLKWLFKGHQKRTPKQAEQFADAAFMYLIS